MSSMSREYRWIPITMGWVILNAALQGILWFILVYLEKPLRIAGATGVLSFTFQFGIGVAQALYIQQFWLHRRLSARQVFLWGLIVTLSYYLTTFILFITCDFPFSDQSWLEQWTSCLWLSWVIGTIIGLFIGIFQKIVMKPLRNWWIIISALAWAGGWFTVRLLILRRFFPAWCRIGDLVICLNMTDNIVPDFFPSQPEALTLQIESITCGIALGLVSSLITGVSLNFCLRPSHPREPEGDEFISRP